MTRLEQRLLKHGTFVGPVTKEMIDLAKKFELHACELTGLKSEKDGWIDFIPEARAEVEKKQKVFD